METAAAVRRHVEFYVAEYNTTIPHSAFGGQTPDEIYFGRGEGIPEQLALARAKARRCRLAENRAVQCDVCREGCPEASALAA